MALTQEEYEKRLVSWQEELNKNDYRPKVVRDYQNAFCRESVGAFTYALQTLHFLTGQLPAIRKMRLAITSDEREEEHDLRVHFMYLSDSGTGKGEGTNFFSDVLKEFEKRHGDMHLENVDKVTSAALLGRMETPDPRDENMQTLVTQFMKEGLHQDTFVMSEAGLPYLHSRGLLNPDSGNNLILSTEATTLLQNSVDAEADAVYNYLQKAMNKSWTNDAVLSKQLTGVPKIEFRVNCSLGFTSFLRRKFDPAVLDRGFLQRAYVGMNSQKPGDWKNFLNAKYGDSKTEEVLVPHKRTEDMSKEELMDYMTELQEKLFKQQNEEWLEMMRDESSLPVIVEEEELDLGSPRGKAIHEIVTELISINHFFRDKERIRFTSEAMTAMRETAEYLTELAKRGGNHYVTSVLMIFARRYDVLNNKLTAQYAILDGTDVATEKHARLAALELAKTFNDIIFFLNRRTAIPKDELQLVKEELTDVVMEWNTLLGMYDLPGSKGVDKYRSWTNENVAMKYVALLHFLRRIQKAMGKKKEEIEAIVNAMIYSGDMELRMSEGIMYIRPTERAIKLVVGKQKQDMKGIEDNLKTIQKQ